jgi:hypothetical protein
MVAVEKALKEWLIDGFVNKCKPYLYGPLE